MTQNEQNTQSSLVLKLQKREIGIDPTKPVSRINPHDSVEFTIGDAFKVSTRITNKELSSHPTVDIKSHKIGMMRHEFFRKLYSPIVDDIIGRVHRLKSNENIAHKEINELMNYLYDLKNNYIQVMED